MLRSDPRTATRGTLLCPTVALQRADDDRTSARHGGSIPDGNLSPLRDPLLRSVPTQEGYKVLGEHVFFSTLGRGATASVYLARDINLGIDVAIKCLLPEMAEQGRSALARFDREARVGLALDHPNVVQILRHGQFRGLRYLVMEYVHGETLQRRVDRRGPSSLGEALGIARRAAQGLAVAHRRGLIHRDIKPANLMLGTAGEVKICDLGLAKGLTFGASLTLTRSVLGTPRYMAPEQWTDSRSVGPSADVYSLGATLFYLLAGWDRNQGTALDEIRSTTQTESFACLDVLAANVPEDVIQVIARCMARNPRGRFPDCQALARVLDRVAARYETALIDAGSEVSGSLRRCFEPATEAVTTLARTLPYALDRHG